jgi:uncharacterized membrane protein
MRFEIAALALVLAGCGAASIEDHPCPAAGTMLTYDNFGKQFLDTHCQRCHGASGSDRQGAPSGYDFRTVEQVRALRDRIFARAAYENTTMPPGPDDPPEDERNKLGEWLSCGAP